MSVAVPVLMYHHVLPQADGISIGVDLFRAQMGWLARRGWRALSAREFLDFKLGRHRPPPRSLLITFDDGWLDNYLYAFPILREFGLRALVFLVTGWVEARARGQPLEAIGWASHREAMALARGPGSLSVLHPRQIEIMAASGLVEFHSHTHWHRPRLREAFDLEQDLALSQAFFQRHLGYRSEHLCWPWGESRPGDSDRARASGFPVCYTTANGVNLADGDTAGVRRFSVKNRGLPWLALKLALFRNPWLGRWYGAHKARRGD